MKTDRWRRLQELFELATEAPPADRPALLAAACDDASLVREVESLLLHGERTAEVQAVVHRAAQAEPADGALGSFAGPYRLEAVIGQGGMGTVYRAERDDDVFRKRVAVKLIRDGITSEERVERFRAERQILAGLDHPHLARLLDGGTAGNGRPYLVMEYVEGEPITEYCDRRRLDIGARLRVFQLVCGAVQYAHQNLVIHRDLKPANILVTPDETPKLLDFGIAKLLHAGGESEALTRAGERPMTPEYASPEQALGRPLTTASDVYSLGVVLYELLTGKRPLRLDAVSPAEIERRVLHDEPPSPSAAVGSGRTEALDADRIAAVRGTRPKELQRRLAGDLDNIVLKALQKDPKRRYGSASQLAEDLDRHLKGLPVEARPDSLGYVAGKFVRRHKLGVAAAVGLIAVTAAFGAAMAFLAVRLAAERNRALKAEDDAQAQARTAGQVSQFLTQVFRVSDPREAGGRATTAREILDRGAQRVEAELKDQPIVLAALMEAMGNAYEGLGAWDRRRDLQRAAFEVRRKHLGERHPDTLNSMNCVAEALREAGEIAESEALHRRAVALRREVLGAEDPAVAESLNNLALVLIAKGDLEGPEPLLRQALEIRRQALGEQHEYTATSLHNLCHLFNQRKDFQAAEPLCRQALERRKTVLGPNHPRVFTTMEVLAHSVGGLGRYREAESFSREAVEGRRRLLGDDHPDLGASYNFLAWVARIREDLAAAEPLQRKALAIQRSFAPASNTVAVYLKNLAEIKEYAGDLRAAETLLREALALRLKLRGPDHPSTLNLVHALGRVLAQGREPGRGEGLMRQALESRRRVLPPGHADIADSLSGLAAARRRRGDLATSESLYREALGLQRRTLPSGHPATVDTGLGLGGVLLDRGAAGEAEPLLREGLEGLRLRLPDDHVSLAEAKLALGRCLLALGRLEDARQLLEPAETVLAARLSPHHPLIGDARRALGAVRAGARATSTPLERR